MKRPARLSSAAVLAVLAAASARGGVLFEENFLNYCDFAPTVTRDEGLLVYVDGVWEPHGELGCNATRELDMLAEPVAAPPDGRFDVELRFDLRGTDPKVDRKTGETLEPGVPSWFDLVFLAADGRRETVRVASDSIAGTPVGFIRRGWRELVVRVAGAEVELLYAEDRGHDLASVARTALPFPVAGFNLACTPERKFGLRDLRATTPDVPHFDFPAARHFADFASLARPLAGAKTAAGGETVELRGPCAEVRFSLGGDTNRTVQVGFARTNGTEAVWTGSVKDLSPEKRDAKLAFSHSPLGEQWVRPSMRPFSENSDAGQRGMVPAGYDVLREWDSLPPASRHVFTLRFEKTADGWNAFLDGSLAATFSAGSKRADEADAAAAESFFFRPSAGVEYAVSGAGDLGAWDAARFRPLDFRANPRAKTMVRAELRGVAPGWAEFGGAPVRVAEPMESADVGICRQGKGNWALEVEEYHGRWPGLGFPMAAHWRVPAATYARAHLLFALDPDPAKDAVLTVRLARYERNGVGGNMLGDTVLDIRGGVPDTCRKVGEVAFGGKTVPLWYAAVPLNVGRVLDSAARKGGWLDVDFTGKGWKNFQQLDNRMKPDPDSTSAFNLFGATLEAAPFDVVVREAAPGNLFTEDERDKRTAFEIVARRPGAGEVRWTAKDLDGAVAFEGSARWKASAAGETNVVEVPLGAAPRGWFSLDADFLGPDGETLFRHEAAFGILPPAERLATRRESPYAVWWFNCHGSSGDPAVGGPILRKCGIRKFSWNEFSRKDADGRKVVDQELYDKYDATSCGNFHVPGRRNNFDPETGTFLPKKVRKGSGKDAVEVDMTGEEFFVDSVSNSLAKLPADAVPQVLLWHESAPGGFVAEELIGEPVPEGPTYPAAEDDAKYINEVSRLLRKHFPDLRLQIGNSTWSAGAVIGPMRAGARPDAYDRIGIETPAQTVVPERMTEVGLQGMQATMDAAEAISGVRPRCNGTWEFVYRTDRDLGLRQQAEWYVRDVLISLAHGFELISPGVFFDTSSGYYNGLWGGSGLTFRSPWHYPKPAIVAYGVLTKALDGVAFVRQFDTGSTTVYAVEFRRKDGRTATALWASRGDVAFDVEAEQGPGGGGTVVRMLGAEERLPGGRSVVKGGTSPCYLVTDRPLQSVRAGARSYPKEERLAAGAKVAAALDSAEGIALEPDPALASPTHRFLPYLRPCDEFEVATAVDDEKGPCVELRLLPPKEPPANPYVDRYVTRYTTMRLPEPKPLEGRPAVIGVWVRGDSNWGQVRFEIEDAQGEVFKNLSTGRGWYCDVMDWPGNLAVNFDGWSYCFCALRENDLVVEHSPGAVSEQWVSEGGDKRIDFPVKLRAISVGMNRSKLDLLDFKPAANVLRFRDAGGGVCR